MPLHEAVYVTATDKIYGVCDNYVLRFNATTGAKEAAAKVCAPCYGPMRIATDGTNLYVSSWADFSVNTSDDVPSNKNIWTINTTTLAATDVIGLDALNRAVFAGYRPDAIACIGPHAMVCGGGYIYFQFTYPLKTYYHRVMPDGTNHSYYVASNFNNLLPEVFAKDGTYLYIADPYDSEGERWTMDPLAYDSYSDISPTTNKPVAVAWDGSKAYGVCGTTNLIRFNAWSGASPRSTVLNLAPVYADVKPMRIRYSPLDSKLYIPCQNKDAIIIWNTGTETGTYADGFASPIDVVFTASKRFAVQSSGVSLLEF